MKISATESREGDGSVQTSSFTRSVPKRKANRDETKRDAGEPELRFRKKRRVWVKKSDGLKGVRAGPLDLRVRRIRVVTRM